MIMVRGRRGLMMSISFRQRKTPQRGWRYVREMYNSAGRPSAEHLYQYSSDEGLLPRARLSCGYVALRRGFWSWRGARADICIQAADLSPPHHYLPKEDSPDG